MYVCSAGVMAVDGLIAVACMSVPTCMHRYMQQHTDGDNFLHLAQAEFNKSYGYVYGPFHSFSEGSGGGGTPHFATGMGTFLQSIVQGWAGVRYTEGALTLRPQQPLDETTNLTVAGIHYRQSAVTLSILPTHAVLTLAMGPQLQCARRGVATQLVRDAPMKLRLGITVVCRG